MWHVYVIKSKEGFYYWGMTSNLPKRLKKHNSGKSYYTKKGTDWKLMYFESFKTAKEARKREKYFKNNAGKEWLRRRGIID